MQIRLIKTAVLAASIAITGGCATITPEQLAEVRAIATGASSDANQALGTANNALSVANDANAAAQEAQSTAQLALECCNANSTKLDRMFEKAMQK